MATRVPSEYELRPGGTFRTLASAEMRQHGGPDVIIDGEVIESDPPRKLVQTWRPLWDPESMAEGAKRLTWEIVPGGDGVCTLTVTHELANAPKTRYMVTGKDPNAGGGWPFMLEDLKRLLETGQGGRHRHAGAGSQVPVGRDAGIRAEPGERRANA